MPVKSKKNGFEVWTISAPEAGSSASFIPAKGGIGSSLVMPGPGGPRELLFQHDFFWEPQTEKTPGGWPFLFPICGRLERDGQMEAYAFEGKSYRMPIHGFGQWMEWQVVESGKNKLTMLLRDTAATREVYPFQFEVKLSYGLGKDGLVCEQTYSNHSAVPLPYYAGFHPYFLTPWPGHEKAKVRLDFRPVRALGYNAKLTAIVQERALPRLPISVASPDLNEQLTQVGTDRETRLIYPDGFTVHMKAEGAEHPDLFPYVQLYTMKDKPFFCVEPWMGVPNALNSETGVRWIQPGHSEYGILRLWTTW